MSTLFFQQSKALVIDSTDENTDDVNITIEILFFYLLLKFLLKQKKSDKSNSDVQECSVEEEKQETKPTGNESIQLDDSQSKMLSTFGNKVLHKPVPENNDVMVRVYFSLYLILLK